MPSLIPVGPYKQFTTAEGTVFPYYIVPFDKNGTCEGPLTRQHVLDHLDGHSDIFLFSHGWNNDWEAASERYASFVNGYIEQRRQLGLPAPAGYRPLLIGIFWPSQALTWFDSETGPGFAGASDDVESGRQQMADIAAMLAPEQRERFHALSQTPALSEAESRELADLLASVLSPDDEGHDDAPASADDLLAAAASLTEAPPDFDDVGAVATPGAGGPAAAGGIGDALKKLDPRNLIKPFTVWQMKDRSGKVGSRGVSQLLAELLRRSQARIHLLGHSFGCKVVMSATASLPDGLRKVHSALLLQPAMSQYAFAAQVPETGRTGGYHRNLQRIERPVVATFSGRDIALSKTFHLALRRDHDIGEQPLAAGDSPSKYAALGGYGPQDSGQTLVDIKDPASAYDFGPGGRIVGVRGTRTISGHGDISNASTWWLAHSIASSR
ncbi:alpha/beta hydrolase [Lysobacter sp. 22409]|uniref:alpha/beta hydrolase n=1 Tax=Lysobacter sp. 22409 TaxID=3453917 RepID=UPI003F84B49B